MDCVIRLSTPRLLQVPCEIEEKQTGFTLVEMMVTLAVAIIILGIGFPAFSSMMSSNRTTGYANELVGALRLARSEAVKRGAGVTVCASNQDNTACEGNNWQNGWLVFTDPDKDYTYTATHDTLIRVWQGMEGGATFNSATPSHIRFLSSGELSDTVIDFAFHLNHCQGNQARTVSISTMGRAQTSHSACF